jgi:hypothetical protein
MVKKSTQAECFSGVMRMDDTGDIQLPTEELHRYGWDLPASGKSLVASLGSVGVVRLHRHFEMWPRVLKKHKELAEEAKDDGYDQESLEKLSVLSDRYREISAQDDISSERPAMLVSLGLAVATWIEHPLPKEPMVLVEIRTDRIVIRSQAARKEMFSESYVDVDD